MVFSAAILTKQGKILLARQFVEMTRMKVENHLATFPKLVSSNSQHNTVETAEVRYVYQSIESLLLVLTTSKMSNIVEDLETLRLFSKLIPEHCPGEIDEAAISKHAFELLFAFDELIACGVGHRENLTLQQLQVNLEMESHEEKLAIMIRQSKEREAQQEAERKRKEIARENRSKGIGSKGVAGGMQSMRDFADDLRTGANAAAASIEAQTGAAFDPSYTAPRSAPPPKAGTGMKLGKGGMGKGGGAPSSLLGALALEADEGAATPSRSGAGGAGGASPGGAAAAQAGITLTAEEKLSVVLSRDGGLQSLELNGILQLLNTDPNAGRAVVPLALGPNAGFQFKTHPNIDKQLFAQQSALGLRDPSKAFPPGSAVGVLKWRLASTDEALVPIMINCWPTQTGANAWEVSIEYELSNTYPNLEIHNLSVTLPTPVDAPPSISASAGAANYSRREGAVTWTVDLIDAGSSSGTVELQLSGLASVESLYPITVDFSAAATLCALQVPEVRAADGSGALPYATAATLQVESYSIQ